MFHETVEVLLENEAATAEDVRISFEMDRREICCNATKLCWIKMAAINVNVSFWMHLLRWVMPLEKLLSGNVWLCRYFQSISRLIEANLREETEMLQLMFEIIERHRRGNSQNRMKNWNLVTEVLV